MSAVDESSFRAQHGEDKILQREWVGKDSGYFVEVGSYNGESYSNTFFLEKSLGWKGVLVEADPKLHAQGEKIRPNSACVNCAVVAPGSPPNVTFEIVDGCRWVSSISVSGSMLKRIEDIPTQIRKVTVQARTLDSVLEEAGAPTGFEFLSIDVEGHEWPVLQGFSIEKWQPKIIILERNDHFPDRRIMNYLRGNGYGWMRTTGCNDWFYAGAGTQSGYALRELTAYYMPKYLTFYRPFVDGPVKRMFKTALRKVGVLENVRALLGKKKLAPAKSEQPHSAGTILDDEWETNEGAL